MSDFTDKFKVADVNIDENVKSEDTKQENIETKKEIVESDNIDDYKKQIEDYKKQIESSNKALNDSKSWGHKNNQKLILGNKRVKEIANELFENDDIPEEYKNKLINSVDVTEDDLKKLSSVNDNSNNYYKKYEDIKNKLDEEFNVYKQYIEDDNLDKDYEAFFNSYQYLTTKQRNDFEEYFYVNPKEALKLALTHGKSYSNNISDVVNNGGDVINYIKQLKDDNIKIIKEKQESEKYWQEKYNNLKKEFDTTYGSVSTRSIDSRSSNDMINNTKSNGLVSELFD